MTDWAMVILTAIYVVATILICFFNYRSAKASREQTMEMKRQYDAENRPYITVELIYERKAFYGLRLTNHGKRIANHVNIQFEQSFLDSIIEPTFKSLLEKQRGRECIIGIGQCYELYFGTNEFRENSNKAPLSGRITYTDEVSSYSELFHIDFDTYATFFSVGRDIDDFLKEIKLQTKELKRIRENFALISSDNSSKQGCQTANVTDKDLNI